MNVLKIPEAVEWRNGMVLEPVSFQRTDRRTALLSHLAGLIADPWPWGFLSLRVDETALASRELRIDCDGVFPDGEPFKRTRVTRMLPEAEEGGHASFVLVRNPDTGELSLQDSEGTVGEDTLPAARLGCQGGVWGNVPDWSPPAMLIGPDHPMRTDLNRQLGALAALGAGFMATLRLPGAEARPVARVLGQVAAALVQGVGVIDTLLNAPAVTPGRVGVEALRLALGVRSAAGIFERLEDGWDPADQRGSMRRLLAAAESAASGIGLPFRATVFRQTGKTGVLEVEGMPAGGLLVAIEASRPADLIAARAWFEGAALAAPDRIAEAMTRRVSGCTRRSVERDPSIGIASGPLLGLYQVEDDQAWRGGQGTLALAAETPPPQNTSFSVLVAEEAGLATGESHGGLGGAWRRGTAG